MKTFIVTRVVLMNQEFTVEADSEQEAIEKAKQIGHSQHDMVFLDTDCYVADEED
jgi:hypothetical protein